MATAISGSHKMKQGAPSYRMLPFNPSIAALGALTYGCTEIPVLLLPATDDRFICCRAMESASTTTVRHQNDTAIATTSTPAMVVVGADGAG